MNNPNNQQIARMPLLPGEVFLVSLAERLKKVLAANPEENIDNGLFRQVSDNDYFRSGEGTALDSQNKVRHEIYCYLMNDAIPYLFFDGTYYYQFDHETSTWEEVSEARVFVIFDRVITSYANKVAEMQDDALNENKEALKILQEETQQLEVDMDQDGVDHLTISKKIASNKKRLKSLEKMTTARNQANEKILNLSNGNKKKDIRNDVMNYLCISRKLFDQDKAILGTRSGLWQLAASGNNRQQGSQRFYWQHVDPGAQSALYLVSKRAAARVNSIRRAPPGETQEKTVSFYNPEKAPIWEGFLRSLTADEPDSSVKFENLAELTEYVNENHDSLMKLWLQIIAGWVLLHNPEQKFIIMHGPGGDGKSTFLTSLLDIFGKDISIQISGDTITETNKQDPYEKARLKEKQLAVCSELPKGKQLNEAFIKGVSGHDSIYARNAYDRAGSDSEFKPRTLLVLSCNNLPKGWGADNSMLRRVMIMPMSFIYPKKFVDIDFREKIKTEAEHILAWAMEGATIYLNFKKNQAPLPEYSPRMNQALREYRSNENPVEDFKIDCIKVMQQDYDNPPRIILLTTLHRIFQDWYMESFNKSTHLSIQNFGKMLVDAGIPKARIGKKANRDEQLQYLLSGAKCSLSGAALGNNSFVSYVEPTEEARRIINRLNSHASSAEFNQGY